MKNRYDIKELNQLYKDAEHVDSEIFAEQRSNILLCAGEHYNKRNSLYWNRIREAKDLSNEQKIRLTKNHIYKVSKIRTNHILAHASNVRVGPNNESELQDQKSAELHQSVWEHKKSTDNLKEKIHSYASDFFKLGEVVVKLYFDQTAGRFLGYDQAVDETTGEPLFNEDGTPMAGSTAQFTGDIKFERIFAFNLLRSPNAKSMEQSPFLIERKMVLVDELKEMIEGADFSPEEKEEKLKWVKEAKDETYLVFDVNKQAYSKEKGVLTLREYYFRPCPLMPQGYYYITVDQGILFEGELPGGIFPIVYKGHDEIETTPRHRSPIKQLRPYQIEINRAASKMAEHQITWGDDKVILNAGAKASPGLQLPGFRFVHVSGASPTVIPGRTGEQYLPYINSQIEELYNAAQLPEELEEKNEGDQWGQLFKSAKQKKKFFIDAEKFEFFLRDLCKTFLELARFYYDENFLIPAIGKNEFINIEEFKNADPLLTRIKIEPMSDDIETQMGKQLMLNHILQYSSGQLSREDIGKLIRMMPYANNEKSFDDFTLSYDRATNLILQLDRGQLPQPNKYDDGPYCIKRLTSRMSQADFQFLSPQIQSNYAQIVQMFEDLEAEKSRVLQAAQADFIPIDGPMIKVGWYVKDPTNSARSIQATLPANAINWLVQRLEDQGTGQAQLKNLSLGAQAGIAQAYLNGGKETGSFDSPNNTGVLQ